MAHFAKVNQDGLVVGVEVWDLPDDQLPPDDRKESTEIWVRTSYNTRGGVHYNPETGEPSADQSKALRKNYAVIGGTYDSVNDAFIPIKPWNSWVLNETTFLWESPVGDKPSNDDHDYTWDEENTQWIPFSSL